MSQLRDHPRRFDLANELHARPFPEVDGPGFAVFLAIKPDEDRTSGDDGAGRAHLIDLLDRHGAAHPNPGATHYFGRIGKHRLKWEQHTEFQTYTIFGDTLPDRPFDAALFDVLPPDWRAGLPGVRVTSALFQIELCEDAEAIQNKTDDWLVRESLFASLVVDESAVVAGDFRIDPAGHLRFAVLAAPDTGSRRLGRIVQRLCEIEMYKSMAMLGFTRTREIRPRLDTIDSALTRLVAGMSQTETAAEDTLKTLLGLSAELEREIADSSYRFGATAAYEAIVLQRVEVLREVRFHGRQTLGEFMARRFDPAMRTVKSTRLRLDNLAGAASRVSELLRTRVDVERSAQNQKLLESMDRRADQQLRLQRTVEGLSVVAVSYYAVNLLGYLAYPYAGALGLSKGTTLAILTPLVLGAVWIMLRRLRRGFEG